MSSKKRSLSMRSKTLKKQHFTRYSSNSPYLSTSSFRQSSSKTSESRLDAIYQKLEAIEKNQTAIMTNVFAIVGNHGVINEQISEIREICEGLTEENDEISESSDEEDHNALDSMTHNIRSRADGKKKQPKLEEPVQTYEESSNNEECSNNEELSNNEDEESDTPDPRPVRKPVLPAFLVHSKELQCIPLNSLEEVSDFESQLRLSKKVAVAFISFLNSIGTTKNLTSFCTSRLSKIFGPQLIRCKPLIKWEDVKDSVIIQILIERAMDHLKIEQGSLVVKPIITWFHNLRNKYKRANKRFNKNNDEEIIETIYIQPS